MKLDSATYCKTKRFQAKKSVCSPVAKRGAQFSSNCSVLENSNYVAGAQKVETPILMWNSVIVKLFYYSCARMPNKINARPVLYAKVVDLPNC